jgi:hypothetical protein
MIELDPSMMDDEEEEEDAGRFVSASLSFMDPLFFIIIDIFLYLCLFGWSVWKRMEYRFL